MQGSLALAADPAKEPAKEEPPPPMATDKLVAMLAKACPVADPGDQAAHDACRKAVFGSDLPKSVLASRVFWGAPKGDYAAWRLPLTAFDQGVFANLYLPLFMFSGKVTVERKNGDSFNIVHVPVAFRNRLQPGQFPYPFWHKPEKWAGYEATNELQFHLEATFRAFAQELRGQSCLSCHVPDNPRKMSPLVLLQTPAHALGEIKRIQNMVTSGQMPLEEWGAPKPLSEADKSKFLAAAKAFGDAGALALGWGQTRGAAPVVK